MQKKSEVGCIKLLPDLLANWILHPSFRKALFLEWDITIPVTKSFRHFFGRSLFVTRSNFMPTTLYMRLHQSFVNTLTCFSFVISVKQNDKVWKYWLGVCKNCRMIENTPCRWFLTNCYSVAYCHTRYPKTIT